MTPIDAIKKANDVLIVCHIRPDGDCLGSGFALTRIAEKLGKRVDFVCDSPFPPAYSFIKDHDKFNKIKCDRYDLAIAVDCADSARMGGFGEAYRKCPVTLNIDHHKTNDGFGKYNFIAPEISSTCELLYSLIKNDGVIGADEATDLYLGISTDTGNFMHSNTLPDTLKAASELLALGADLDSIVNGFYRNNTKNKLALVARAVNSMRYFDDDKVVVMTVTQKDLTETGCVLSDTEGLIDYGMSVGSVKVAVCMTEQRERSYKVSLRSKGADVSLIAGAFGGGGHKQASGCVVNGYYEDVVEKIVRLSSGN